VCIFIVSRDVAVRLIGQLRFGRLLLDCSYLHTSFTGSSVTSFGQPLDAQISRATRRASITISKFTAPPYGRLGNDMGQKGLLGLLV
jgi:hypothetical protein